MKNMLDFRNLSTVGIFLGGIATVAQVLSLPLLYVTVVAVVSIIILGVSFYLRWKTKAHPYIPPLKSNAITIRKIETPAEFEDLDDLYHLCFGSSSVPTEVLRSWWMKDQNGMIGLFKNGEIIGGISIWSINDDVRNGLLLGSIAEREILASHLDTESYNNFYVSEIAIIKKDRNHYNLIELIQETFKYLKNNSNFPITIFALGYSKNGINLMKRFGFIKQLNANRTQDKQPLFRLSLKNQEEMALLISNLEDLQKKEPTTNTG